MDAARLGRAAQLAGSTTQQDPPAADLQTAHEYEAQRQLQRSLDSINSARQSMGVKRVLVCLWMSGLQFAALECHATVPELAEYRGHVVWLDFWASWCTPCRQSFPWMQGLQQHYANRGLVVVAVNVDHDRAAAERFLAGFPHDFVVRFDSAGALPTRMHAKAMPTSFLLDAAGNVVATHLGFKPADAAAYQAEVEKLLNGSSSK